MTSALSDYFRVTAERVNFTELKDRVLRDAYITGTGVLYTYWDEGIPTGQYADFSRTAPVGGDIACEVLDIDNVFFGDPTAEDLQAQPYILIAQRRGVDELRRQARRRGCPDWRTCSRPGRSPARGRGDAGRPEGYPADPLLEGVGRNGGAVHHHGGPGVPGRGSASALGLGGAVIPSGRPSRWERGRGGAYGRAKLLTLSPTRSPSTG